MKRAKSKARRDNPHARRAKKTAGKIGARGEQVAAIRGADVDATRSDDADHGDPAGLGGSPSL